MKKILFLFLTYCKENLHIFFCYEVLVDILPTPSSFCCFTFIYLQNKQKKKNNNKTKHKPYSKKEAHICGVFLNMFLNKMEFEYFNFRKLLFEKTIKNC